MRSLALLASVFAIAGAAEWQDPSKHQTQFVTVDENNARTTHGLVICVGYFGRV